MLVILGLSQITGLTVDKNYPKIDREDICVPGTCYSLENAPEITHIGQIGLSMDLFHETHLKYP